MGQVCQVALLYSTVALLYSPTNPAISQCLHLQCLHPAMFATPPPALTHTHTHCRLVDRQAWLWHWLGHHHPPVRTAAARLLALAASADTHEHAAATLARLLAAFPSLQGGGTGRQLEEQEGAVLATGVTSVTTMVGTWAGQAKP